MRRLARKETMKFKITKAYNIKPIKSKPDETLEQIFNRAEAKMIEAEPHESIHNSTVMYMPRTRTAWTAGFPNISTEAYQTFSLLDTDNPAVIRCLLEEFNINAKAYKLKQKAYKPKPKTTFKEKLKKLEKAAVYSYLMLSIIITVILKIALIPVAIALFPLVPIIALVRIIILIPTESLSLFFGGVMEVSSVLAYDWDWGNADYDTCLGRSYSGGLMKGLAVVSLPIWGPFLFGFITSDASFGLRVAYGLAATLTFLTLFGSNTLLSLFQLGGIATHQYTVSNRMSRQGWTMTRQDKADLDSFTASAVGTVGLSKIIGK